MVSLIFGILALACNIAALFPVVHARVPFLAWIGFVLAIVAVATGGNVLKADPRDKSARAGKAIGTVCIVLAVLGIVLYFAFAAGAIACVACAIR